MVEISIHPTSIYSFMTLPVVPLCCRNANLGIVFYDITDKQSFCSLPMWIEILKNHALPNVELAIVGTKCDMEERRQVGDLGNA